MKRLAAVILAMTFIGMSGIPAEAKKHGRGWNNSCQSAGARWIGGGGYRRNTNGFFFGVPQVRHDNGRHLGWYNNGKRYRSWW